MIPAPQSLLHTSYWLRKTKVTHTHALLAKSLQPPTQSRPLKTAPSSQHVQQPTSKIGSCCKLCTERLLSAREPPTCPPRPTSNFQLPTGGRAPSPVTNRVPTCTTCIISRAFHVHFTCISRAFHVHFTCLLTRNRQKKNSFALDLRERMRVHMCGLANEKRRLAPLGGIRMGLIRTNRRCSLAY
ncbi:hypothetical protein BGZ61DRAFT_109246 [Ilyonectria robusta]|uniref:uncharacterized protein n=1 Tax=Ilyonectria robusta TaxID=1079257 RepID=UPI001E8DA1DA|nr:uncharacterized protein BGZ61DRAFT_109246 [Ilyonectria robusta]KAH8670737.1 hypothetical protein BGZ61DRAFT_109246 [Ilyonectria robusta]